MIYLGVVTLGLAVGVLAGLMGIAGGVILVPAMVCLLSMDQHLAQGTSLFLQLPPLGLGALLVYARKSQIDFSAGCLCAAGILVGGFLGSKLAISMDSRYLKLAFGVLIVAAAILLWYRSRPSVCKSERQQLISNSPPENKAPWVRLSLILTVACCVGVCAGFLGVGGGVLLVPLLVLLFRFEQHTAQGTSLVALVPPTGLLAFLNYAQAHQVSWLVGLLIMPGVFLGGLAGGRIAQKLSPQRMRSVFAGLLFLFGAWQILSVRVVRAH